MTHHRSHDERDDIREEGEEVLETQHMGDDTVGDDTVGDDTVGDDTVGDDTVGDDKSPKSQSIFQGLSVWKWSLSILLGLALLKLSLPAEDFKQLRQSWVYLDWTTFMVYWLIFSCSHLLRIARWGLLIRSVGQISWRQVMRIGGIGYALIVLLPFRSGELARPYLVQKGGLISLSTTMGTVIIERVADGLLFVGIFFLCLSVLPEAQSPAVEIVRVGAWTAGVIFMGLTCVLTLAVWNRSKTFTYIRLIGDRVHRRLTDHLCTSLDAFLDGVSSLPTRRVFLQFILLSIIYWIMQGAAFKVMAIACGVTELSVGGGFALLSILVVGIMVPAGPGFTGSFEFALKAGFAALALTDLSRVPLFIAALHLAQLSSQVIIGLFLGVMLPPTHASAHLKEC